MADQPNETIQPRQKNQRRGTLQKMKNKMTFQSYMGCCSLRTGTLIIGYFNAIILILLFAMFGGVAVIYFNQQIIGDNIPVVLYIVYILVIVFIDWALHVTLLHGVYKEKCHLVLRFMRGYFWLIIITFIVVVILAISVSHYNKKAFAVYPISVYHLLVVRSYYLQMAKDMRSQHEMEASRQ